MGRHKPVRYSCRSAQDFGALAGTVGKEPMTVPSELIAGHRIIVVNQNPMLGRYSVRRYPDS